MPNGRVSGVRACLAAAVRPEASIGVKAPCGIPQEATDGSGGIRGDAHDPAAVVDIEGDG